MSIKKKFAADPEEMDAESEEETTDDDDDDSSNPDIYTGNEVFLN